MARSLAFLHDAYPLEMARITLVLGCALALIAAGRAFPF